MGARSVLDHLRAHARDMGGSPAYGERIGGRWVKTDWSTYDRQIRRCARALLALGVEPQQRVAVLSNNCPQWAITCLGAMSARAISVGIYQTCSAEQVRYILNHAEAPVVMVENRAQLEKVESIRSELTFLRHIVVMREEIEAEGIVGWEQFMAQGDDVPEADLEDRFTAIEGGDYASFIYTSGTTGDPKAVILSHGNIFETARIGNTLHALHADDSVISYLPMAHIAEQMISVHMPAYVGYTVYYAEAPEQLLDHLVDIQPTIFFGVPRVWERFHSGIRERLRRAPAPIRGLIAWASDLGRRVCDHTARGTEPGAWLRFRWALANRLLLNKLRHRMGLSGVRVASAGAAPIKREILDFFAGLGVLIYEIYGLSESNGPGTWNRAGATRLGTVGPAIPEIDLKLGDDGEVMFRGPNIFQGYFKDPEATAACMEDGWLRTGDIGTLDDEGFLSITGRKKELIITSGGKNIPPAGIESRLKEIPLVGDAMVIGDNRRFLVALLTVDETALATVDGRDVEISAHEDTAVVAEIHRGIQGVNQRIARVETVRNFRVLAQRFSTDTEELTPTLKLKRRVIETRWEVEIEEMYEEGQILGPDS